MTFRSGHQAFIEEPGQTPPLRRYLCLDGSCPTCNEHRPGESTPPHDASARCESGKRNHCTCDICF